MFDSFYSVANSTLNIYAPLKKKKKLSKIPAQTMDFPRYS